MVNIKINDVPISVEEGTTILEACREAKMIVPTLCYLKDINEIGACRVCVVEIKGIERLVTSCNNTVKEGMENNTLQKRSGLWTSLLSVTRANVSNVCAVSRFVIKYSL